MFRFIENVILEAEVSSALEPMFVLVGAPMEKMWKVIMPETRAETSARSPGEPKTARLKELLDAEDLNRNDRLWAHSALAHHKIMIDRKRLPNTIRHRPALPYLRSDGGMPLVEADLWSLPSSSAARAS